MISKSTICSIIGSAGVVITSVLAVKCYKKTKESDDVKTKVKKYAPAIISGGVSIGCIMAADRINKKELAAATAATAYFAQKFTDYEKEVREMVGDEKADEIEKSYYSKQINKQVESAGLKNDNSCYFIDKYSGASIIAPYEHVLKVLAECEQLYKKDGQLAWCDIFYLINGSFDMYESFIGENLGWSKTMYEQWYGEDTDEDLELRFNLKEIGENKYLIDYKLIPELGFFEY